MIYTIRQYTHYARPLQLLKKLLGVGKARSISANVSFYENCRYDIDKDQSDINKLYGLSFGYHHKNSARIGWRYNKKLDKIELTTYCYLDGVRLREKSLGFFCFAEKIITEILIKGNLVKFVVNGSIIAEENLKTKGISYPLSLYFGGNQRAPHDMNVELNVDWR